MCSVKQNRKDCYINCYTMLRLVKCSANYLVACVALKTVIHVCVILAVIHVSVILTVIHSVIQTVIHCNKRNGSLH